MALSYALIASLSLCSLSINAMQYTFITYYIDMYVNGYMISSGSFLVAQAIFLVWNSVNDSVFSCMLRGTAYRTRVAVLALSGILWSVSFALMFSIPPMVLLPFSVLLFFYDAFLTIVSIIFNSFLCDLPATHQDRTTLNAWCSAASLLATGAAFATSLIYEPSELAPFRVLILGIASVATASFSLAHYMLLQIDHRVAAKSSQQGSAASSLPFGAFMRQLSAQKNLVVYCITSFLQVFNCHLNSNYFLPLLSTLLTPNSLLFSSLLSATLLLPHVGVVILAPVVKETPTTKPILTALFLAKIVIAGGALAFYSWFRLWALAVYLLVNRIVNEIVCRHSALVVAELVAEDSATHQRSSSEAPMILGTIALLTQPGQSIAAVVGWSFVGGILGNSFSILAVMFPLGISAVQLLVWQRFKPVKTLPVKSI